MKNLAIKILTITIMLIIHENHDQTTMNITTAIANTYATNKLNEWILKFNDKIIFNFIS